MLPLTRHGTREMIIGTVLLLCVSIGLGLLWWPLALVVWPVIIWLFAFFRDPERPISVEPHLMVSPADGVVSDVEEIAGHEMLGEPCLRIGIFLSVFNVHVNRSPCEGIVAKIVYKKGKFINAMSHNAASSDNESNTILLADPASGKPVAVVKQIVGLIARRIICDAKVGDLYARGQRFGMIKFGSRTELYIPMSLGPTSSVKVGQKVRGGMDVIARLAEQSSDAVVVVGSLGGEALGGEALGGKALGGVATDAVATGGTAPSGTAAGGTTQSGTTSSGTEPSAPTGTAPTGATA